MPLLKNGKVIPDQWVELTDNETVPADSPVIVSLERWLALREILTEHAPGVGVYLENDVDVSVIAEDLDQLKVIVLTFPKFADGRAYSQARLLRRLGFKGELRAIGDLLRDQFRAMDRCGFDTLSFNNDLAAERAARAWSDALGEFSYAYQPAERGPVPVLALRHQRKAA